MPNTTTNIYDPFLSYTTGTLTGWRSPCDITTTSTNYYDEFRINPDEYEVSWSNIVAASPIYYRPSNIEDIAIAISNEIRNGEEQEIMDEYNETIEDFDISDLFSL